SRKMRRSISRHPPCMVPREMGWEMQGLRDPDRGRQERWRHRRDFGPREGTREGLPAEDPGLVRRFGELEIDQEISIQEKVWKIQRGGWLAMLFFILAGASGLLGNGPLSSSRVTDPSGRVEV